MTWGTGDVDLTCDTWDGEGWLCVSKWDNSQNGSRKPVSWELNRWDCEGSVFEMSLRERLFHRKWHL